METLKTSLKHHLAQYGPIAQEAWQALHSQLRLFSGRKNQTLHLKPGGIYFVGKGLIKECVDWQGEGEITILRLVSEGTVMFAPKAIFGRFYKALEDCELLELTWQAALLLSLRPPGLRSHYECLLSAWLQLLPDRVSLMRMPRDQRKKQFLVQHPSLKARITNSDLANYLATSHDFGVC